MHSSDQRLETNMQRTLIATLAIALCAAGSAHAGTVSIAASGAFVNNNASGTDLNIYTQTFNAGADAEMLVVSSHADTYSLASLTYGGETMTLVPGTATGDNRVHGIYYLVNPSATGDIVATYNAPLNATGNSVGFAAASLNSSDGNAIAIGAADFAAGNNSNKPTLTLDVPEDDSFVFIATGNNGQNTFNTVSDNLVQLDIGVINSMGADAGYDLDVPAGTSPVYTFTASNNDAGNSALIAGASFHVVPEPTSLALLGLGGLMLLIIRRRR
jgi:hypothetical protein